MLPDASLVPSGLKARAVTQCVWPVRTVTSLPVSAFHSPIKSSLPPEAIQFENRYGLAAVLRVAVYIGHFWTNTN